MANRKVLAMRRRFDQGDLPLDGTELVPLNFLWYETSIVTAHMRDRLRGDFIMVQRVPNAPPVERLRCADDLYDLERRGPYVRFDKVDRIFTRYGLMVHELGDPLFSTHGAIRPRAVAC